MGKPIKKILIANRGEIACRVMKTARKMGIATVAVYSDADRKALHVRMADESVHIGASPAVESYLMIDKIIGAAKETGADAIHPGYGFLSENPSFVRACEKAGITFIGPSAEAMEAMGLKDAAKALMDKAGVPTTPGYLGAKQDGKTLKFEAGKIGYPVLIKAVAGGGGKGMRKVDAASDFDAMLASCQREAKSSFGDDRVLIEKYITSPRHIEVQVFGDSHGNVVHMFERDCSLQRRHQKVIEEAPAPGMTDAVRTAMTDAAIKAAKAVDYVGAGTVEFIVDGSGALKTDGFWFMEMNTRLQVEHPVTEMVTGLDLVELQIRVAQGEALMGQDEITLTGHAIEARLYAEDPSNDFLPSVGKLSCFDSDVFGRGNQEVSRIDTGVEQGDIISVYYDPMVAKVIAYSSQNRSNSISLCIELLSQFDIAGIATNSYFLLNCLKHPSFQNAAINTGFIINNFEALLGPNLEGKDEFYAFAALRLEHEANRKSDTSPFACRDGWRNNLKYNHRYEFVYGDAPVLVEILELNDSRYRVSINGKPMNAFEMHSFKKASINKYGNDFEDALNFPEKWACDILPDRISIRRDGFATHVLLPNYDGMGLSSINNALTSPMPGKIIAVNVAIGDSVKAGDPLIVMEAMKMEMTLDAPRDGMVASVGGEAGDLVGDGHVLLELEDLEKE